MPGYSQRGEKEILISTASRHSILSSQVCVEAEREECEPVTVTRCFDVEEEKCQNVCTDVYWCKVCNVP